MPCTVVSVLTWYDLRFKATLTLRRAFTDTDTTHHIRTFSTLTELIEVINFHSCRGYKLILSEVHARFRTGRTAIDQTLVSWFDHDPALHVSARLSCALLSFAPPVPETCSAGSWATPGQAFTLANRLSFHVSCLFLRDEGTVKNRFRLHRPSSDNDDDVMNKNASSFDTVYKLCYVCFWNFLPLWWIKMNTIGRDHNTIMWDNGSIISNGIRLAHCRN